jgi:integrase
MDAVTTTTKRAIPWNQVRLAWPEAPAKAERDLGYPDSAAVRLSNPRTRVVQSRYRYQLRGCDLIGLRVHDVVQGGRVAPRAIVTQKKTPGPVQFEITEQTRDAVAAWIAPAHLKSEQFLFSSRVSASAPLIYPAILPDRWGWAESIGLDPAAYDTHSLRRTKPTLIYRRTKNLRAVQLLLGHTKLDYLPPRTMSRWPRSGPAAAR